ncbi:hypothetical protein D3C87_1818760 [compost metagenome]
MAHDVFVVSNALVFQAIEPERSSTRYIDSAFLLSVALMVELETETGMDVKPSRLVMPFMATS